MNVPPAAPPAPGFESWKFDETILLDFVGIFGVLAREAAVVLRLYFAAVVFLHIAALDNPFATPRPFE